MEKKIVIAKDFSQYPGARYRSDGKFSGEEFYEDKLKPLFDEIWEAESGTILIDLDGTFGYASSFISEVFSRLVKDFHDKDKIKARLHFKSEDDPILEQAILDIIDES